MIKYVTKDYDVFPCGNGTCATYGTSGTNR